MRKGLSHMISGSLIHYRKAVFLQIIIISILSAVITGSLLTGFSVRNSLRETAFSRMGNTSVLVSSGLRYFNPGLSERLSSKINQKSTEILETEGFCQNFSDGTPSGRISIYGIGNDFFRFNGNDSVILRNGEVAINSKLANRIKVKAGDEIIIRIKEISDIPADAPFSTGNDQGASLVMNVAKVLSSDEGGDFSLAISQIVPSNLFIRAEDLSELTGKKIRFNRLLSENTGNENMSFFSGSLDLKPEDLGLILRKSEAAGMNEFISSRVFIDRNIIDDIKQSIPGAEPVITYLANSIVSKSGETPYSFVSGVPSSLYPEIDQQGIIINRWIADDLKISENDTVVMKWFAPDSVNQLVERSGSFPVRRIVKMDSVWGDRTLMPEFPGIAGTESCSEWDAGMDIDFGKIRDKDEEYWTEYKGTPKAFISYDLGRELWGSNYGPATAIRFPSGLSDPEIEKLLSGKFDPARSGFIVTDLREQALKAAGNSVDFGTLFISLGFFILFSSMLLLSLSVSAYFDNKKEQVDILHKIGFRAGTIKKLLFAEMAVTGLTGSIAGTIGGLLVNNAIITALNTVWTGAVQTDTLTASAGAGPMLTGLISSLIVILVLFLFRITGYLKSLENKKTGFYKIPSRKRNTALLIVSASMTAVIMSIAIMAGSSTAWFVSGIFLFLTLLLLLRQYFTGAELHHEKRSFTSFSRQYYKINPSQAVTPAIFIAAGIFALFITSLNRMDFDRNARDPKSGTGGYLFWAETSVPVNEDLSVPGTMKEFGLDEEQFRGMILVQMRRMEGNDASCLNLNHITSPPLLGVDPDIFVSKGAFSFASAVRNAGEESPWKMLEVQPAANTIYGIADQTVLDWGLKIGTGDTLVLRSESGQPVYIIIAGGLKSSVFQGNVIVSSANLKKYFPSVTGSSVFLADGDPSLAELYSTGLADRFGNYGITVERTSERLASFYRVTNTYLSVFTVLGALGMILGVFGLAFVLLKNYNQRKREFALLVAVGYPAVRIRRLLFKDLFVILGAGLVTGIVSGLMATFPTLTGSNDVSPGILAFMVLSVFITGIMILSFSVSSIKTEKIIRSLRKE